MTSEANLNYEMFRNVPGPSPWYTTEDAALIPGFRWKPAGDDSRVSGGKTLLVGPDGAVAVLNYYNCVMVLDSSTLLIWHQLRRVGDRRSTSPVDFLVVEPGRLSPFKELNKVYEEMNDKQQRLTLGGEPSFTISLPTTSLKEQVIGGFPPPMQSIDELLIMCHSSAVSSLPDSADLALMVVNPTQSTYCLYPQDWFNCGDFDFGYQWVTRIARNPQTRKIHGEGIRIESFVLDDTLRNLSKSK